jgi:pilus assembly protein Flp/PilA
MTRFLKNDHGATAIEYALIAASMGLALVAVMPTLAGAIKSTFSSLATHISTGS